MQHTRVNAQSFRIKKKIQSADTTEVIVAF